MSNRPTDARRATSSRAAGRSVVVAPGSVAPVGRRVAAYAVDMVLLLLASVIGYLIARGGVAEGAPVPILIPAVLCVVVGAVQWVAESVSGATAGNALLGIRTMSARTGRPAGLLAILLRDLVVGAGSLVCLVGQWVVVASGVWDTTPAQRGWHDKAAGTLVLRAASVSTAARVVAGPAAWDDAVARAVGRTDTPSAGRAPSGPAWTGGAGAGLAPAAPGPLVPISVVPGTPLPSSPEPEPAAADPVPMIDVPAEVRPAVAVAPVAPDVIGAPPVSTPNPVESAQERAPLIEGPPSAVRSRRELRLDERRAPEQEPRVPTSPLPDLGDLELTRLRDEPAPRRAGGSAVAAPGVRLAFDTGERVDVVGDGLVGRSPSAEAGVEHVVAIDDPERSISKVHLAFGPTPDGGLWVTDRGSTNGTVLVAPGGSGVVLPAGARVGAPVGSTIRFGQRSVRVERV